MCAQNLLKIYLLRKFIDGLSYPYALSNLYVHITPQVYLTLYFK